MLRAMDDIHEQGGEDVEEFLEMQPHGGALARSKKVNRIGVAFYGEKFESFDKLETLRDLIPLYKAHFYGEKIKNPKATSTDMVRSFNEEVAFPMGRTFFPYMKNISLWKAKWERDIAAQKREASEDPEFGVTVRPTSVRQVLKTRDAQGELVLGTGYNDIEAGLTTLAGELTNDAMQMLRDDQAIGELYDDEVLIKRRNYIVNVFGHVTKLVHGKAALILKASEEKRENAGFMMTLIAKATAGKLSEEEMNALKTTYAVPVPASKNEPILQ